MVGTIRICSSDAFLHVPLFPTSLFCHVISLPCCCHRRSASEIVISVCGFRRLVVHLTCENWETATAANMTVRTVFYSPTTAGDGRTERVLKLSGASYCVRRGFELSLNCHRGSGKSNELHARRELCLPAMGLCPRTRRPPART